MTLVDATLVEKMTALEAEMAAMRVRVLPKAKTFHEDIGALLKLLTFGGQSAYMTDYVTTLGRTIYVPPNWPERTLASRYETLRHEMVHVRQFERYGFLLMALAYVFLPMPIGLAWCRYRLEREAYEESMRVAYELEGAEALAAMRDHVIEQFVGPSYAWMWPFPSEIAAWYDETARAIAAADGVG